MNKRLIKLFIQTHPINLFILIFFTDQKTHPILSHIKMRRKEGERATVFIFVLLEMSLQIPYLGIKNA